MMATAASEVPLVEADKVRHEYADGREEKIEGGIAVLQYYRNRGDPDDMEREVFLVVHMPAQSHEAAVSSSRFACIRSMCERRARGLKL